MTQRVSSRDYVYEVVKDHILNLKLKPGTMISEKEISEKFQVSRTPTREAFIKLEEEELIVIYPQKGSFVSLIDLDQVEEARFLRENMEVAVLKIACATFEEEDLLDLEALISQQVICSGNRHYEELCALDDEFHRTLFVKCGKERTWAVIQHMLGHYKRFRNLLLAVYYDWETIILQHMRIVEYIRNRSFELAEQELRTHVKTRFNKKDMQSKYPSYFKGTADNPFPTLRKQM